MRTPRRPFAAALLAALGFAASASAAAHPFEWDCWLHAGTQVACTVVRLREAPQAVAALDAATLPPAALLRAVRGRPGALVGQLVYVPLHTVPFDDSPVAQLVTAVLCGLDRECGTHYHASLQHVIEHEPAAFADLIDPVLGGLL